MKIIGQSILPAAIVVLASLAAAAPAAAFEQSRSSYAAALAQVEAESRGKVPASFRIQQDDTREKARLEGASRYFGGEIRTLIVNGRPVRLSEREIIENIRSGHFVPVYTETGNRLSRADWEGSLPHWLGYATREFAAP